MFGRKQKPEIVTPQESSLGRHIATLATGNVIGQIITIGASPFLSRLYTPEDFGNFALFSAICSACIPIVCLRYELVIPIARSTSTAVNATIVCAVSVATFTALSLLCTCAITYLYPTLLPESFPKSLIWLIPIAIVFGGYYMMASGWGLRQKIYKEISLTRSLQALCTCTLQLLLVPLGPLGLAIGQSVGQGAGATYLAKHAKASTLSREISRQRLLSVLRSHRQFPYYSAPGAIANSVGAQAPLIIIATCFDATIAGLYFLAHRITSLPSTMIGQAIGKVYLAQSQGIRSGAELKPLVSTIVRSVFTYLLPAFALFAASSSFTVPWAFGKDWSDAGWIAIWTSIWAFSVLLVSPVSMTYEILGKQKVGLVFQSVTTATRILVITIGVFLGGAKLTIVLFCVFSAICWLALLAWICSVTHLSVARGLRASLPTIACTAGICSPTIVASIAYDSSLISALSLCISGTLLVAYIIWQQPYRIKKSAGMTI